MPNASDPCPTMIPTLGQFVTDEWLPSMRGRLKASTWDSYRRNLELHVLPSVGETAIDEVRATVDRWSEFADEVGLGRAASARVRSALPSLRR